MWAKPLPPLELLNKLFTLKEPEGVLYWADSRRPYMNGRPAGWITTSGYIHIEITPYGPLLAHRIIWVMRGNSLSETDVMDHIDGNRLNNSADNLRIATMATNAQNRKIYTNSPTGVSGVTTYVTRRGETRYRAQITLGRRKISLGSFMTIDEAVGTRESAADRLFRDYAPTKSRRAGNV